MAPAVSGFDPDAPDEGWSEEVWVDPFDEPGGEHEWVEPLDDLVLDTPAARADAAYGRAIDPSTPSAVLAEVAADLASWDVEALLAEAAIDAGMGRQEDPPPADRPEVLVLRSLLRNPNRPDELADVLLRGWLEDPAERSPWPVLVGLADGGGPVDEDLLVTAVTEACDAARTEDPPAWAVLLVAVAAARADGGAVRDLLALAPFPHDDPTRLFPDAETAAKGLPGGTRARATAGADLLGWNGRRYPGLPAAVAEAVHQRDRRSRSSSFADRLQPCPHGPVLVTPGTIQLPAASRGPKPYVALITGTHPVFRLKREWPDRDDVAGGTSWAWAGAALLEARGLGCDACRDEPDNGKRYLVSTGRDVAPVRLATVRAVLDRLERGEDG